MKPTPGGPLPFDEVVRRHGATVLRVCRAVLGPGPDADDAWSETFLAALRAWPATAPAQPGPTQQDAPAGGGAIENPEAWLVRIAQRKCVDVVRSRDRRPIPDPEPGGSAHPLVTAPAPDTADDIWSVVASLPDRQRLAVAYHWFGGLPHTETAELTGSTPAAVRRAAADGLATLRRVLAVQPAPPDRTPVDSPSPRRAGGPS